MEEPKYIYTQIAEDIHEDRPRILVGTTTNSFTVYIEDLSPDELAIYQAFVSLIESKANS